MFSQTLARLKRVPWEKDSQVALLFLLAFAILWRGGRTLETTLLLGLAACAVVLFRGRRSCDADRPIAPVVWWLTIAFVLWSAVSYVFTTTMNYGFDEVAQTASLALLFLWMARRPRESKVRMSVLRVMTVTVLLACLIGVLIYAMGPINRFVGTFLDIRAPWKHAWPNAWAELLLLAWPVALLLARPDRAQGKGAMQTFWMMLRSSIPAGVMVGCLILSFSRAAFLAFLGQGLILLFWSYRRRAPWKRVASVAMSTLFIALVIFGLSNYLRSRAHAVQSLSERTLFLAPEGMSSIAERKAFWRQGFDLSLARPIFGWGPGSFRFAQTALMEDVLETSDHPHNVLLKVALERGWPAAIILLTLTLVLLLPLVKGLFPPMRSSGGARPFLCPVARMQRREVTTGIVLLLTAVLGVLAHNLVDFNLHYIAVSLPTVLILGMLAETEAGKTNKKFVHKIECALTVILLAAVLHEGFYAVTSTVGRRADTQGDGEQALLWYGRSKGEWYSRDLSLAQARVQLRVGFRDAALETLRRYTEVVNPIDARGWLLYAQAEEVAGHTMLAETYYQRAYALGRYTDLRILRSLLPLLSLKSETERTDRKEEFAELLQQYYDAILRNSHYTALTPNVEEFVRIADFMGEQYPEEAPRYQVMAAGVVRQAKAEREKQVTLQSQVLW